MSAKKMLEKHKDVARIDQESKRTHGWYVRVRFMGKTHSKFFSDGKYGGRYSSLLAALAWRDQTEISLGKVRTDRHIVTVSNTKTGMVGVRLNEKLNRYEVSWVNTEGRQGKTSVSIRKHGHEQAFDLACQIRQQKESERLGLKKPASARGRGKAAGKKTEKSAAGSGAKTSGGKTTKPATGKSTGKKTGGQQTGARS